MTWKYRFHHTVQNAQFILTKKATVCSKIMFPSTYIQWSVGEWMIEKYYRLPPAVNRDLQQNTNGLIWMIEKNKYVDKITNRFVASECL